VVILDLRDLSFMDCSGLRVVLDALDRAEANGQRLVLVGAGSRVLRLFEVLRMEHLLTEDDDGGAGHSMWDGDGYPSHREARGFPNG
jgi:anti-anti-sigma factor